MLVPQVVLDEFEPNRPSAGARVAQRRRRPVPRAAVTLARVRRPGPAHRVARRDDPPHPADRRGDVAELPVDQRPPRRWPTAGADRGRRRTRRPPGPRQARAVPPAQEQRGRRPGHGALPHSQQFPGPRVHERGPGLHAERKELSQGVKPRTDALRVPSTAAITFATWGFTGFALAPERPERRCTT